MMLSTLGRYAILTYGVLLVLAIFSRFSMSESSTGAHAKRQAQTVCRAGLKRAKFYADTSEQDESLVLALLHICEARAHALASKELAERTGVVLQADALSVVDEQQDRLDALLLSLHDSFASI
jgi:hypothetical protein